MNKALAPRFTYEDAQRAGDDWGCNCGPAALAMVAGLRLSEVRKYMGDFESKGHTNPTLMFECLNRIGVKWTPEQIGRSRLTLADGHHAWPNFGLVRVQWEGPWTAPGVPMRVRYRHTHWVGAITIAGEECNIFDINAMLVGGWIPLSEWATGLVPWLLKHCEPKANGHWHLTHVLECEKPR